MGNIVNELIAIGFDPARNQDSPELLSTEALFGAMTLKNALRDMADQTDCLSEVTGRLNDLAGQVPELEPDRLGALENCSRLSDAAKTIRRLAAGVGGITPVDLSNRAGRFLTVKAFEAVENIIGRVDFGNWLADSMRDAADHIGTASGAA